MKKNKIIFFPFFGDSIGGSHLSSFTLIDHLYKIKYDYLIIIFKSDLLEKYLIEKKLNYVNLNITFFTDVNNSIKLLLNIIINISKVLKLFQKYKPFLVHTNDIKMHYFWSIMCKLFRVKHLWHQHSAFYSKKNIFFSSLSSEIITVSRFCKFSFTKTMSKRAIVVFNPFEVKSYKQKKLNKKNIRIISFVGSDKPQKGLDYFLDIANSVRNKIKNNLVFFIFGNISQKKQIIKKNSELNIRFFDFDINYLDKLIKSDLVLLTSKNEGFGRVLVECMLSKIPFIARESGSFKELIINNKNSLLAKTKKEFCENIIKELHSNNIKIKKEKLHNLFKYASKYYNEKIFLRRIKTIYDNLR